MRGSIINVERKTEPYTFDLYRGFDADLKEIERQGDSYVLSPEKSEQGVLWFTHQFITYYDPIEYAKSHGDTLITYPLQCTKHWEEVTYENGDIEQITVGDIMRIKGANEDEISVIDGSMDAREFAMKKWGWKRLEGRHIETWTLTPGDLNTISSGLFDAYGEDVPDEEEFTLHVHSTGKTIYMTYAQINQQETNTEDVTGQLHKDVYDKQFEEQDKDQGHSYYEGRQGD